MKALAKERTRRYATVGELAADLRRHLDNQPVLASPPSTFYRAHKFVRRNRLAVVAAVTASAVLVVLAASMTIQARRIAKERDRANQEATAAKQVSDFLVGLFTVSDPAEARGETLTARAILDRGAARIQQDLSSQPEVQGRLQTTIGTVMTNLGAYKEAESLLDHAIVTLSSVVGDSAPPTLTAMHQRANLHWYQGRYGDAEKLYLKVVEQRRRAP